MAKTRGAESEGAKLREGEPGRAELWGAMPWPPPVGVPPSTLRDALVARGVSRDLGFSTAVLPTVDADGRRTPMVDLNHRRGKPIEPKQGRRNTYLVMRGDDIMPIEAGFSIKAKDKEVVKQPGTGDTGVV